MIYFDTAYLLKCYINETGSEAVRSLANEREQIACCEYGRAELFGALHRCLREKVIDTAYFGIAVEQFELDEQDHVWTWLPLTQEIMHNVVEAFKRLSPNIFLRTADAVHLQCAVLNDISQVFTNDKHMLIAGSHFGLNVCDVIGATS